MRGGRARTDGRTLEARVFLALKCSMTPRELVKMMGEPMWGVRHALYRLRDKGYVRKVGALYERCRPRAPKDERGQGIESRSNLMLALPGEGAIAKLRNARGRFIPKPEPKTAIERAWGFLHISDSRRG